jgi:hypothetical protein
MSGRPSASPLPLAFFSFFGLEALCSAEIARFLTPSTACATVSLTASAMFVSGGRVESGVSICVAAVSQSRHQVL